MAPALDNEIAQFRELVRHFFSRFFDNDLIAINTDAADMRATVVNILAMLAAPGMLLPFLFKGGAHARADPDTGKVAPGLG